MVGGGCWMVGGGPAGMKVMLSSLSDSSNTGILPCFLLVDGFGDASNSGILSWLLLELEI